jgi:hypothetical protein
MPVPNAQPSSSPVRPQLSRKTLVIFARNAKVSEVTSRARQEATNNLDALTGFVIA